jgi:hypothetical protein
MIFSHLQFQGGQLVIAAASAVQAASAWCWSSRSSA